MMNTCIYKCIHKIRFWSISRFTAQVSILFIHFVEMKSVQRFVYQYIQNPCLYIPYLCYFALTAKQYQVHYTSVLLSMYSD